MKFHTLFDRPKTVPVELGSDTELDFRLAVNEYGIKCLVQTGSHSIQDRIQSYHDSVEINHVIERCILTGDYSPLQIEKVQSYADLGVVDQTAVPRTLREVRQLYNEGIKAFNSLPADERSKYSTFEAFLNQFDQSDQYARMRSVTHTEHFEQESLSNEGGDT